MIEPLFINQYTLTSVDSELEINYIVTDATGYICRLVPGEAGFEVSKSDKALGIDIPLKLLSQLSDLIVRQDA